MDSGYMAHDYVTRDELTAHLDPMRTDIASIASNVQLILDRSWLGNRGRTMVDNVVPIIVVTLVSAGITEAITYLI